MFVVHFGYIPDYLINLGGGGRVKISKQGNLKKKCRKGGIPFDGSLSQMF